uniref:Uncharacterized protein n=1 Tax=Heliothis virescens TaxID=7102 RepID=A0A2A4IWK6_HELVI
MFYINPIPPASDTVGVSASGPSSHLLRRKVRPCEFEMKFKMNTSDPPPEDKAKQKPYQKIYTIENLKKLTADLMMEDQDTKYRNFVVSTAFSDMRPNVDTAEQRLEHLHDTPRFDPDKAMMSI